MRDIIYDIWNIVSKQIKVEEPLSNWLLLFGGNVIILHQPSDSNKHVDIKFSVHDLYRVRSLFRQYNMLKLKLIKCL